MKIFGVVLLVLALGLAAIDTWVRSKAEARVSEELQRSFDPKGEAEVALGGFPFTFKLLAGSIPEARIESDSMVRPPVRLTALRMALKDIEFSVADLSEGDVGAIRVGSGEGTAELRSGAVNRLFESLDVGLTVDISGGRITASIGPVSGSATAALDGNELLLTVQEIGQTFDVDLPLFARGMTYDAIRVNGSRATVEFSFTQARFEDG